MLRAGVYLTHELQAHFSSEEPRNYWWERVGSARTTSSLLVQGCTYVEGAGLSRTSYKRPLRARTPVTGGSKHDLHELQAHFYIGDAGTLRVSVCLT